MTSYLDGFAIRQSRVITLTAVFFALAAGSLVGSSADAQTFATQTWSSGVTPGVPIGGQCVGGDFNGDGLLDIACYTQSGGNWALALSGGSSFTTQVWNSSVSPSSPVGQQCITGDFNGDGRTDIACYTGSGGSWALALSSGSGFSSQSWGGGPSVSIPITSSCVTGDFNGDGRTDIACYTGSGGSWNVGIATGSSFVTQVWAGGAAPASSVDQLCTTGDFNGDGRTDIACYSGSGGNWNVALSTGSGFTTQLWSSGVAPGAPIGAQCVTGDFNGDGRTDVACYTQSNGVWAIGLSSGSGFVTQQWSSGVAPTGPVSQQCATGDFNGDGLTDITCYTGSGGAWKVGFSTGAGIVTQAWSSGVAPAFPISNQCVMGDINGDGLADLACYTTNGAWAIGTASPAAQ
jgi:hypothetical protein